VETIPSKKSISPTTKSSFLIKKLHKNHTTASQPKLQSIENLENHDSIRKNL
jgi:hypothetical protein